MGFSTTQYDQFTDWFLRDNKTTHLSSNSPKFIPQVNKKASFCLTSEKWSCVRAKHVLVVRRFAFRRRNWSVSTKLLPRDTWMYRMSRERPQHFVNNLK